MKIHIPAFKAMAKCNEHLNHVAIDIDLGDDVVKVVRCRECIWYTKRMCYHPRFEDVCEIPPTMFDFDYCRYGERKECDD